MSSIRRHLVRYGVIACLMGAATATFAQEPGYPTKPITLVVPFPAGGVVDIIGRLVAESMAASLKSTVVVDNKPGAGGTVGAAAVARAKPDGYTVLLGGSATHVFGPSLYTNLTYDPIKGFAPIGQISSGPLVVVVGSKTHAQTVSELVTALKGSGDTANYGSNGNGTFPHLAGELFKQANQLRTVHVPYGGGPAVVTALISGDLVMSINHIPVVQGMVKSGKLKAIATTGTVRSSAFPDLPTLSEAGMKGFEANAWFGLFAPAGTPAPIVERLSAALAAALKDESVRTRLLAQGDEPSFKDPRAFGGYVDSELVRWTKVIKAAKVTID